MYKNADGIKNTLIYGHNYFGNIHASAFVWAIPLNSRGITTEGAPLRGVKFVDR
jgi:hypothetical protein